MYQGWNNYIRWKGGIKNNKCYFKMDLNFYFFQRGDEEKGSTLHFVMARLANIWAGWIVIVVVFLLFWKDDSLESEIVLDQTLFVYHGISLNFCGKFLLLCMQKQMMHFAIK